MGLKPEFYICGQYEGDRDYGYYGTILCKAFSDKFPHVFYGLDENKYIPIFVEIIRDTLKKMGGIVPGNMLAVVNGRPAAAFKYYHNRMPKEPWKPGWKVLRRHFGFFRALKIGYRMERLVEGYKPPDNTIYIDAIGVLEEYRGKGIGGAILDYIREIARRDGIEYGELLVLVNNERAISLYKRKGFRIIRKYGSRLLKKLLGVEGFYLMRIKYSD